MFEEGKKLFSSPLIYMLFIFCMILNLWVLWNYREQIPLVKESKAMAEIGVKMVDAANVDAIACRFSKAVSQGNERIPTVLQMMAGADVMADALTSENLADGYISNMNLVDGAANTARLIFDQLAPVMEENKQDGTARVFFVPCNQDFFQMYSSKLLLFLMVESIVVAVLLAITLSNDAFSSKISDIVYTCKKGRKINNVKLLTSITCGCLFTAALWGMTLGIAALLYPLGSLWHTPLGSMMVLDNYFPIIGWHSMTVLTYMIFQFFIAMACVCLFIVAAYGIVTYKHHSFGAFMAMALICAVIYTITYLYPRNNSGYFLLQYNPVDLARKAGHWLVNGISFMAPEFYEMITLLIWGGLLGGIAYAMTHRFYKEDL